MTFAATFPAHLDVAGIQLETHWIGPGPAEAPTLVLLHEGLGSVSTWGRFPERLAATSGLGVFVFSRHGYGRSTRKPAPWPLTYMHDEALQMLHPVLDAAGVVDGILVGHSDGASIAAIYAGAVDDERVRGLVLMAPHFFTEEMGLGGIRRTVAAFAETDLRTRLARHHGDNVDDVFHGWSGAWLDPDFRMWDLREYLARIRTPILAIQGRDDQYGTLAQIEALQTDTRCAVETLLLDSCGHTPHQEAADATLSGIAGYVDRLRSPSINTRPAKSP